MCRICRAPEPEKLDIIACIDRGESDRAIAARSRHSRMGVWRFRQHLREQRTLLEKQLRDARLRNAKFHEDGRIIVEWPGLRFTLSENGEPFDIRDFDVKNDTLIAVEFDPLPATLPNPPKPENRPERPEAVPEIAD